MIFIFQKDFQPRKNQIFSWLQIDNKTKTGQKSPKLTLCTDHGPVKYICYTFEVVSSVIHDIGRQRLWTQIYTVYNVAQASVIIFLRNINIIMYSTKNIFIINASYWEDLLSSSCLWRILNARPLEINASAKFCPKYFIRYNVWSIIRIYLLR